MESLTPNIFVMDIEETIDFYGQLGFSIVMTVPEQKPFNWAMVSKGNVSFMFQSFKSLGSEIPEISRTSGGSILLYIRIKEVRNFYESIKAKVSILKGLETTFYGATECSIQDNNGFVLTFSEEEK